MNIPGPYKGAQVFLDNTVPFIHKFLKGFLSDLTPAEVSDHEVSLTDIYSDWSKNTDLFSPSDTENSKVTG